jgi:hypothetical protein
MLLDLTSNDQALWFCGLEICRYSVSSDTSGVPWLRSPFAAMHWGGLQIDVHKDGCCVCFRAEKSCGQRRECGTVCELRSRHSFSATASSRLLIRYPVPELRQRKLWLGWTAAWSREEGHDAWLAFSGEANGTLPAHKSSQNYVFPFQFYLIVSRSLTFHSITLTQTFPHSHPVDATPEGNDQ